MLNVAHPKSFALLILMLAACTDTQENRTNLFDASGMQTNIPVDSGPAYFDAGLSENADAAMSPLEWGDIINTAPEIFFASDLSIAVQDGVTTSLRRATEVWGNYGPLEYWVLGTDKDAALSLINIFCQRRGERNQWDTAQCLDHHTRIDRMHNMMSYVLIAQQAIEENRPGSSAGRNGRREWDMHLFTSSYPFGFDRRFQRTTPEEETKIIFHEYFHAVQHAHIQSKDHQERDRLLGPTWFVEGGAEYMASYTTAKLRASGELEMTSESNLPTFAQTMEWNMQGGQQSIAEHCPGKSIQDISYDDACGQAAYSLGTWGIAYLLNQTSQTALIDDFYPQLDRLGWTNAFENSFDRTPEEFYAEFEIFLQKPWAEQVSILPVI